MRNVPPLRMLAPRCFGAVALFVISSNLALADVRIRSSPGGDVLFYLRFFEAIRETGDRVIVDGPCLSACTLVLSVIPADRLCVTRRASFGFHAAVAVDRAGQRYAVPAVTQVIGATYPTGVRAWIDRHGGLSRKMVFLSGRELTGMFASCQ